MRTIRFIALISLLSIVFFVPVTWSAAPQKKPMTLATATIGGAYYPVGQAMSSVIGKYVPGISMTPEVTDGAVENLRLVGEGDTDFGITMANTAFFALNGQKPYQKKIENLAAIGSLHPAVFQIVVLNKSKIRSFADLKGKKVAVGPPGGGTLIILQAILEAYGMKADDIQANYLPYSDGFTQLGDDNLDAALALGGYPTAAVMEIGATQKVRLIELEEDRFTSLLKKYPYYSKSVIPKEVYKQEKDVPCVGIKTIFFTKKNMDEKLVYDVTKALYDHLDELGAMNATARQIDRRSLSQVPIPLHPGAKRYFDQKK